MQLYSLMVLEVKSPCQDQFHCAEVKLLAGLFAGGECERLAHFFHTWLLWLPLVFGLWPPPSSKCINPTSLSAMYHYLIFCSQKSPSPFFLGGGATVIIFKAHRVNINCLSIPRFLLILPYY